MAIPVTSESVDYLAGALRAVAAIAKERKLSDIYGVAQAGLDLAEHGEQGCAEMRGDAEPDAP